MEALRKEIERKRKLVSEVREATEAKLPSSGSSKWLRQADIVGRQQELQRASQERLDASRAVRHKENPHVAEQASTESGQVSTGEGEGRNRDNGEGKGIESKKRRIDQATAAAAAGGGAVKPGATETDDAHRKVHKEEEGEGDSSLTDGRDLGTRSSQGDSAAGDGRDNDDDDDYDGEEGELSSRRRQGNGNGNGNGNGKQGYLPGPNGSLQHSSFSSQSNCAPERIVRRYLKHLISAWEWDLRQRDAAVLATAAGKREGATYRQCVEHIQPLLRLCKTREVPADILVQLVAIVRCCEEGNFAAANDHYLQAAIGNAPWPIGLTMVGIHERSGREKISTAKVSQVANVMNNELQRKYFTSIKRLITFAQSKREDVGPSLKVL